MLPEKRISFPSQAQGFTCRVAAQFNPQGGANGGQPFGPETNRTSSAAASRRPP
jgi:hypothetical protein